jgi:hypothetical protein
VELCAVLQGERVVLSLGIGQLDPVARAKWPPPRTGAGRPRRGHWRAMSEATAVSTSALASTP